MRSFLYISYCLGGSLVPLLSILPGPINTDDGVRTSMVIVCQIDDQPLSTKFCTKEMSTLLDFLRRVESEKVLNPISIREIQITEGLKTQNYVPSPLPPTWKALRSRNKGCRG